MQPVKRIEIVADSLEVPKIVEILERLGVTGWTVIRDVTGSGDRGSRAGDELTDVFKNSYVLTTCQEERLGEVVEAIRPVLKKFGGVCLVSDALWIEH